MGQTIDAKILKAAGALVPKPDEALHEVHSYVRVRPSDGEGETLVEAVARRSVLRIRAPGDCDEGVLIDRETTQRLINGDEVLIEGNEILRPFHLPLERDDGSTPKKLIGHDIDPLCPDSMRRVAFSISPQELAAVMTAVKKCGVATVDIMLPAYRGGPIAFRGSSTDDRFEVEGAILPSNLFGASSDDDQGDDESPPGGVDALPEPATVPAGLPFDETKEAAAT